MVTNKVLQETQAKLDELISILDYSERVEHLLNQLKLQTGSENDTIRRLSLEDLRRVRTKLTHGISSFDALLTVLKRGSGQPNNLSLITVVEVLTDPSLTEEEKNNMKEYTTEFIVNGRTFKPRTEEEEVLLEALKRLLKPK